MLDFQEKPKRLVIIRLAGFTPTEWRVISLPRHGKHECKGKSENLSKFLSQDKHSAVVVCGTQAAPKDQRGKIIGLAYCAPQAVRAEPLISEHMKSSHRSNHGFKYPWGLRIERAVYFKAPYARTDEVLGAILTSKIPRTKYLECDDERIISKILNLEVELEINISETGQVSLPEPSSPEKRPASPTFTYIFRFGTRDCWKIGYSKDLVRRQKEFAQYVPHEVLKEQWSKKPLWKQEWPTKQKAKAVETTLLEAFRSRFKCHGERVQCTSRELKETRDDVLKRFSCP